MTTLQEHLQPIDNVQICRRNALGEWVTVQTAHNVVSTYGKGAILDPITDASKPVIGYFEVGAGGRETLGASSTAHSGAVKCGGTSNNAIAQTFYATSGNVSRFVAWNAGQGGVPVNDLRVDLYAVSGEAYANPASGVVPTGAALTSAYYRSQYVEAYSGGNVVFNVDYLTTPGSRYAVVLGLSGTPTYHETNCFNFNGNPALTYSSGCLCTKSGTAWSVATGSELYFKEYYPTYDGAPIAKIATDSTLLLPVYSGAITSASRSGTQASFTCDLNTIQGDVPGKVSEFRVMTSISGSGVALVAFRDEGKGDSAEMQIVWNILL